MTGKCETCRWWEATSPDFDVTTDRGISLLMLGAIPGKGECHLEKPMVDKWGTAKFPVIFKSNFCGQWKERG